MWEFLARKRLSRYQLLISKAYGMLWSYIRNFRVKRTLTKTFAEVSNEKRPIQVTRFLGNEWWNICKKAFVSHYWRTNKKEEKKQQLHRQLQSFLHYTQTQKLPALIMIYQIYFRCQPLCWQYFFLWCPTKNELHCRLLFRFTVITAYRTEGENVGDWLRFLNSFIKRFWPVVLNFFLYFCNDNEKDKHLKFVETHFLISYASKVSENLKIMKNIVRIMTFKKMLEQN